MFNADFDPQAKPNVPSESRCGQLRGIGSVAK